MDAAREFRVFVPPPAAAATDSETSKNSRTSAISQYKWPFAFEVPWGFTLGETVAKFETGAKALLQEMLTYAKEEAHWRHDGFVAETRIRFRCGAGTPWQC